jgi:3-oxoacyl-[acyl-carrier-protein] synthase II
VTTVAPQEPLAITGCGVVSPAGVGLAKFKEYLELPRVARPVNVPEQAELYPPLPVHSAGDIRLTDHVGRKGTRRLDRMVGLALVASKLALESAGRADERTLRSQTGVAIGTSTGSIASLFEIATNTLTQSEPYMIEPSRFPNTVLNSAAGQIAIWNSLKAVNATVAGGHVSSTSALRYAANAIRRKHAKSMLAGGIEEVCPQIAWAWHRAALLRPGTTLAEGAGILVVEDRSVVGDRPVLAELLGTKTAYRWGRTSLSQGLADCITKLLADTGVRAEDVGVVALGAGAQVGARRIEEQGVRLALGFMPDALRVSEALGETYSAGGALQTAAVLARWSGDSPASERYGLVTSLGRDGSIGCLLLRRPA